ncbi:MAG: ABC transporter substrate-binding protein [Chloroflexi bacterium SZAS-1]|nr:ABC transporter substrate-binding protein [Chloroflexi bacterium SZAS-1]
MRLATRILSSSILIVLLNLLAACGSTPTVAPSPTAAPAAMTAPAEPTASAATSAPTAKRTQYPISITDCGGRTTTYDKAPERVVTLDPSITEALLLLGLKSKIVGFTEFQTPDQRWAPTKAEMDALKVINDGGNYPSKEAIVAVSPDLVMSIYPSALLSNKELPDRDGWAKLGVKSFLTQGECHLSKTPVTDFSLLYADLRSIGVLFDVRERAEAEIAKLQARVAGLQQKVKDAGIKPLTVWSYSGEDEPYPAGGVGTPNAVITLAGAKNAFGDIPSDYDSVSWEEIVKRNPDVIWVMTSAGPGYIDEMQGIQKKLDSDPRLVNITAVKKKAYIAVSYNEGGVETPRNIDALEQMINGLVKVQ